MDETRITYRDGMAFDVELEGHGFTVDAAETFGGRGLGPKPKTLLLSSLAGCTGMDVVAILKKMRVPFDSFSVDVKGQLTETHPKVYESIHITYRFTGEGLDPEKLKRAVNLSLESYCGVTVMLGKTATITHDIVTGP